MISFLGWWIVAAIVATVIFCIIAYPEEDDEV